MKKAQPGMSSSACLPSYHRRDPIRPGVGLSGEELVDMLEEEVGVERGEVLEPNPAVVGVATGEWPRHEIVSSKALDGALPDVVGGGSADIV